MSETVSNIAVEPPTGLEDVIRSVRALARSTRNVASDSVRVVEREIAMSIDISRQLQTDIFSSSALEEARKEDLPAKFRRDVHNFVDLVADAGSVIFLTATKFLQRFVDEPRQALDTSKADRPASTA